MRLDERKAHRSGARTLRSEIAERVEVALRLGHLRAIDKEMPRMKPVPREGSMPRRAA